MAPVLHGNSIPYIGPTPVVTRSREDRNEPNRTVIYAYGPTPRVGYTNILDVGQRFFPGCKSVPSEGSCYFSSPAHNMKSSTSVGLN